jgi:hypothetical protein
MGLEISGIVGLDLSITSTGLARWGIKPETPVFHTLIKTTPKMGTQMERCRFIADQIQSYTTRIDLFFIEDYAYGIGAKGKGKAQQLASLGQLGGIVKSMGIDWTGCEPFPVAIGTWKKFLSNNGNLNKDSFKLEVFKKHGIETMGNDDAAAIGICDFARCLLKPSSAERKLLKYELALTEKYKKDHPELKLRLQSLAQKQAEGKV